MTQGAENLIVPTKEEIRHVVVGKCIKGMGSGFYW